MRDKNTVCLHHTDNGHFSDRFVASSRTVMYFFTNKTIQTNPLLLRLRQIFSGIRAHNPKKLKHYWHISKVQCEEKKILHAHPQNVSSVSLSSNHTNVSKCLESCWMCVMHHMIGLIISLNIKSCLCIVLPIWPLILLWASDWEEWSYTIADFTSLL